MNRQMKYMQEHPERVQAVALVMEALAATCLMAGMPVEVAKDAAALMLSAAYAELVEAERAGAMVPDAH